MQFLLFESYSCADRAIVSMVHDALLTTAALLFRETERLISFLIKLGARSQLLTHIPLPAELTGES